MNPNDNLASEDQKNLAKLGYEQELFRGFSAFSNYALSLSIICILAGGITSFHIAYCQLPTCCLSLQDFLCITEAGEIWALGIL